MSTNVNINGPWARYYTQADKDRLAAGFVLGNSEETKKNYQSVDDSVRERVLSDLKEKYNLSDSDIELLTPLLASGASESEILDYVNKLVGSRQSEDKNSLSSQLSEMRSVGYNPDLSGGPTPSINPVEAPAFDVGSISDVSSSSGSLSSKFDSVSSLLFKTLSFGLQAYGLVSGSLMKESADLAGLASADILGLEGDSAGMISDVPDAIKALVESRGLKGRKARKYASYVSANINSVPVALERLKTNSSYNRAQGDLKVSEAEISDDVINNTIAFIKDSTATKASVAKSDLLIAKAKEEWLLNNLDVTAEELELALKDKRSNSFRLQSEANKASADASKAISEAGIAAEHLEQSKIESKAKKDEFDIEDLRRNIDRTYLNGVQEMIEFCKRWESMKLNVNGYFDAGLSPEQYRKGEQKYKAYKKLIKEYYGKGSDYGTHGSIKTPIGSVNF